MKNFLHSSLGVLSLFCCLPSFATDKFEVLPDLPEPLAYAVQPANAASVTGSADIAGIGAQSIGNEPNLISVVFSLIIVVLLIYLTGIIYAKLNRVGFKTMKKQQGDLGRSYVSVVSTTQLGNNKTLHVVELDGKRMLIGASSSAIQLIKDLGSNVESDCADEYSHIEIPNIKIPKIEIPKIEIPTINFSKLATKTHKPIDKVENNEEEAGVKEEEVANPIEGDNAEGIIDSLFTQQVEPQEIPEDNTTSEHVVDPEDFALYKKYLG